MIDILDDPYQKYAHGKIQQQNKLILVFTNKRFFILDSETLDIINFIYFQKEINLAIFQIYLIYAQPDELDKFKFFVNFHE